VQFLGLSGGIFVGNNSLNILERVADIGEDEREMSGELRKIHYFLDFIFDLRYQIIMRNDALIHTHIPGKITVMILY
jgi:hypothetical protein